MREPYIILRNKIFQSEIIFLKGNHDDEKIRAIAAFGDGSQANSSLMLIDWFEGGFLYPLSCFVFVFVFDEEAS